MRMRKSRRGATYFGILIALLLLGIAAYLWFDIFGPQWTPAATIWFELTVLAVLASIGGVAILVGLKL